MSTGTLDTADSSNTGLATPPPGPPLDWDKNEDLIWIKREIQKSTLFGREAVPVDWMGLFERASGFLIHTTDWVLVVATARATVQSDGLSALPRAVDKLRDTINASWETMHPLPTGSKRRVSSLTWFVEGLAEAVNAGGLSELTLDNLESSLERLSVLDEALRSLMEEYPGVRLLRESLKNALEKAAPPVVTPDVGTPPPVTPPQVESRPSVGVVAPPAAAQDFPPPIDNIEKADWVLSKARAALFAVANAHQSEDASDATAYRLRRLAAWLRQTEAPLHDGSRLAGIQGPSAEERQHLRGTLDTDHKGVVTDVEQLLERYPLWLDANYLSFLALSRGGPSLRTAAEVVRVETLALVRRLPMLLDLAFSDNVPLASPDTHDWLQSELAKHGSVEASNAASPSSLAEEDALAAAERTAGELASQGQLEESFKVLDVGIRAAHSGRERFRWRLAVGRLAAKNGRVDLAVSVFCGLHREAKALRLDMWEPELWTIALTSMLELGKKGRRERLAPEVLALLPDIEQQLSRLDLMAAVRLSKERG